MHRTLIAGLVALLALPAAAQESQVKGWDGLNGREPAVFKARVVDVLCELTGDCAEKCGEGRRQMGLVHEDGRLILAAKNAEAGFQGAAADLYPFCGQNVTVDGLMIGPEGIPAKVFQVHFIRAEGDDAWIPAKRWTRIWKRQNREAAAKKGPWFRNDPAVNAEIARDGYLGLGAEADAAFIKENY